MPPELLMEVLESISVRRLLPDLASRTQPVYGAIPLAQIAEAIERAHADMFVSYVANGAATLPTDAFTLVDDGHFPPYPGAESSEVSAGELDKYGASTRLGYSPGSSDYVLSVGVELEPLRDRSPGLVWAAEKSVLGTPNVTFVAVDGETYSIDLKAGGPSIERRVPPVRKWPPIANPVFGRIAFATTRRDRPSPLAPLDDAFAKCAEQAWSRAKQAMSPEQKEADPAPAPSVIRAACTKHIAAWERTFAKNLDANIAARAALVDKAKVRITSLGIAR